MKAGWWYRHVNGIINRYESRTGRTFGPGSRGYRFYRWWLVDRR